MSDRSLLAPSYAHVSNALALLVLVGGSLFVFNELPERIPRHAPMSGETTAYWETTLFNWMLVPLITLALVGFLYAMSAFIGRRLDALSIPDQKKFDTLHADDKRRVVAVVQRFLYWTAFAVTALFLSVHGSFYRSAVDPSASFAGGWLSILSLAVPFGIVVAAIAAALKARRMVNELAD